MRLFESSVTPTSAPSAPGAERAARRRGGAAGSGPGLPEVGPCWYRLFRWSWARAEPGPAHVAFRAWSRPPRPSAATTASPAGAMAAAAGDGSVKPLQCAMKLANGAIELDTGNRPREAYTEYLRSIHYISQVLLEEVEATKGKTCLRPAMPVAAPVPSPASRHRRVYSDEGGKLSPFLPPEIFQKLQVVESQSSKKELTPLEEASLQNQKLKAAYEARMARLDPSQAMQKTSLTLSLQRQMMENLVIAKAREDTLQRKMEERRLRLQEAANKRFCSQVALTPEEREQRAVYAAILEYEQDHDWPKLWKAKLKRSPGDLSLVTSLVSHLLSVPDHPISQLLKKLQCAVYRALYPIVSKGAAPSCCSLPPDADGLLAPGSRRLRPSQSLYCMPSPLEPSPAPKPPDGPCASPPRPGSPAGPPSPQLLGKDSSFEDLEQFLATPESRGRGPGERPEPQTPGVRKEPVLEQLKGTVQDIHDAIDRLLSLTLLAFEGLNTAASKDRCLACIEEPFFSPLWPLLLAIYRWGPAPEVHLGATLRGRLPFPASGVLGSQAVPCPPSRILGVAGSPSRVSVRPGAGVFGPLNLASLHPRNVHRLREAALSRSMELYRNAPPAAIGVPTRLLPQDPEAAGAGPYPYCAAAQELGLLVLESCPQKKLECIGEGAVWEGRAVSRPTGHPESAPLSHSLVPSGGEESLGTKAVLVLPCLVLHGVGVRRCPGPVWDAVPTPSPEAWLLRLSSGLAGHLCLCGGLLPGPGGCVAAWHRRYWC
ncbi:VPS9 domain-containing protein 1 isoform X4 [Bos javanicus]|uniref:VPS9 domain-containing protein 1 isoform X4 n=1 Tax=Bos javanicus TaxID=9906 RepID=UPI002AA6AD37|nr:VPS9 domain-containing protein 1 isoform X4 [Bos javanicus]